MKFILSILFFFAAVTFSVAQYTIKGKVIDINSKVSLPFVNIIDNNNHGCSSDIDGNFTINSSQPITWLKFSYVGYEPFELNVLNQKNVIAKLSPTSYKLSEFVLLPGENPAHQIINKVVANRKIHNPEKSLNFKYESYNKFFVTGAVDTSLTNHPEKINDLDSNNKKAIDFLEKQHLFLMESVTEKKYLLPDKSYEKIIASRVSGLTNNTFSLLATEIQSFSFYNEMITVMDNSYLNPISVNSTNKYFFLIEDTSFFNNDTVFIISFRPKKGKNFKGLKGLLYINTNGYAIQNVIAEPAQEEDGFGVKIQQQYERFNESWFPVQLNTTILFKTAQINDFKILGIGKSYLKNIDLNPDLEKKEFGIITTEVANDVTKKDENFWNNYRNDTLTEKEKKTYHIIDSLGKAENFDAKIAGLEALMTGKLAWGFVDLDINRFFRYNDYEGFRIGAGIHTNSKISKIFTMGGYGAFGTKDKTFKYGGDLTTIIDRRNDIELNFSYQKDVVEPGVTQYYGYTTPLISNASNRNLYLSRMNNNEKIEAQFKFRTLRYLKVLSFVNQEKINVTNDYFFKDKIDNSTTLYLQNYSFTTFGVEFKYAFKQKVIQTINHRYTKPTKYPILYTRIEKGINQLDGEFEYTKVTFKTEKEFLIKNIGKPMFSIEAGYIDGNVPLVKMNTSIGTFKPKSFLIASENVFETMLPYEFFSNQFAKIHFKHNFGSLLFKTNKFAPEIVVLTSAGIGKLNNTENHGGIEFKTMEKGFYESGVVLNNILKLTFTTFGVSVHYRYGAYQFKKSSDNITVKMSLGYSF